MWKVRLLLAIVFFLVLGVGWYGLHEYYRVFKYVSSEEVRSEFEAQLSKAIGGRVHIADIFYDYRGSINVIDTEVDTLGTGVQRLKVRIPKISFPWSWTNLLTGSVVKLDEIRIYAPRWILTQEPVAGYYGDDGLPVDGLPVPPPPLGTIVDGVDYPHLSSIGWDIKLDRIKIVEGTITLNDDKGREYASIQHINAEGECHFPTGGNFILNDLPCTAESASFDGTGFTCTKLVFKSNLQSNYDLKIENWTAESPFGALNGDLELPSVFTRADLAEHLKVRCPTCNYSALAASIGMAPGLFAEASNLCVASDWNGWGLNTLTIVSQVSLTDGRLAGRPTLFLPLSALQTDEINPISAQGEVVTELKYSPKAQVTTRFKDFTVHLVLPGNKLAPFLDSKGTGSIDYTGHQVSAVFDLPLANPKVAALIGSKVGIKKLADVWHVQLTGPSLEEVMWKTYEIPAPVPVQVVKPGLHPVPTAPPTAPSTSTPAPHHKKHH